MKTFIKSKCSVCAKAFTPKTPRRKAVFCSLICRNKITGFKKGHLFWDHPKSKKSWIKTGQRLSPKTEFQKRGGEWIDQGGYMVVYSPQHPNKNSSDAVAQHRLVVESALGRYLEPEEVVHHRNGIKTDNRIENLELHTKSSHAKEHWSPITRKYASVTT